MAAKKLRGLGRGLNTLLGADVDNAAQTGEGANVVELSLLQLKAGKYQPRTTMESQHLQELADSIREQGVISPIIVREIAGGKYEIIAGERRFRASKLAGKKTIPAIVRTVTDKDALAMALIENMQREDLNTMEEAFGIERLLNEFGYTHEQAAQAIGRSRSATSNLLRLINLTEPVKQMVLDNQLEMGHARALLALEGAQQVMVAKEIIVRQASVREAEKLVAREKNRAEQPAGRKEAGKGRDVLRMEEQLSETYGTTVRLSANAKGRGKVTIEFADLDALDALIEKLLPKRQ